VSREAPKHAIQPDATAASGGRPGIVDVIVPATLFVAGTVLAWRYELIGRGPGMVLGYPLGAAIQLFFGMIGVKVASMIHHPHARMRPWFDLLRLAGAYALFDVVESYKLFVSFAAFVTLAFMCIAVLVWMFRKRGRHALWIAMVAFLIKVIGATMAPETVYAWFAAR